MKRYLLAVLIILIPFFNMVSFGYGVWDKTSAVVSPVIQIGAFEFPTALDDLGEEVRNAFFDLFGVTNLSDLYNNTSFQNIMSAASCIRSGCSIANNYTLNDVQIQNYSWRVEGLYVQQQNSRGSIGFLRQIDRTLDNGVPIYPVLPPLTTDPNDNYFIAYDVLNTATNNNSSIRLDNRIQLTTESPVSNLSKISFYALRGLQSNANDNLANRSIVVSISADGVNFTPIRSQTITAPTTNIYTGTPVSQAFPFYEFELTQNQIDNMPTEGYYVRILFNGEVLGNGNNATRSRVIIDELTIHLLDE